ncbi:pyridoxamine 5'-phosphate oxidase family protein [Actinoplanes sp. NPDC026619]|uniref:pyridoxamine 5'-phosphate oxidase family protein n=1 Tax=Actinoplanes sp. NPDC026619 TaxID=3155798 RepID=UPI0033F8A9E7
MSGTHPAGPGVVRQLTVDEVWRALSHASFAVLSHVTPGGEPRSSGVVYVMSGNRMYVVVAQDSWKARQITANESVAVTVPIRRGGVMSLLVHIPPATISFPATALVHPGAMLADRPELARLAPPERRDRFAVVEITPAGHFVTYGVGVPLMRMSDHAASRARLSIEQ